jgi:N-acetylglutamate synthase-like GNAT family acetyltransferase
MPPDGIDGKGRLMVIRHFGGHMVVEMVVVHPAYWRRGHGKALVKWGLELAETDGVESAVFGTIAGEQLYLSLGFVRVSVLSLKDEEEPPNELEWVILKHYGGEAM